MKYLLQHFSVSNETLPACNRALRGDLRIALMRVSSPNQVHRDIGIDEDRLW